MNFTLRNQGQLITSSTPLVMGIVNATPDSFFEGSRFTADSTGFKRIDSMVADGVDIIDVGGQSTRPGAERITEKEELKRIVPVIEGIKERYPNAFVSIDTFYGSVADAAFQAGAGMVNDVSAWSIDPSLIEVVAEHQMSYVLMHMQGTPQTMQSAPSYENVVNEVYSFFTEKLSLLAQKGIADVCLDPGFGFGKTVAHNFKLLQHLDEFNFLNRPILAGLSRKSMLYKPLNIEATDALNATTVANTIALQKGAAILRVHDVKSAVEAIKIVSLANAS
ncbi:MAG: dihydropteroate synthase [Flavobacteriales bacterium]|nr:dihydropteroate synthase [Flavobacteriales bacterium]MDG1780815.1 dihydropteroate synthase [Flavobacteriales bacterium]MDG2245680.1 dihydropteroate synthase [Flavobacteriales bacterium]